jgi:hypothetical protein
MGNKGENKDGKGLADKGNDPTKGGQKKEQNAGGAGNKGEKKDTAQLKDGEKDKKGNGNNPGGGGDSKASKPLDPKIAKGLWGDLPTKARQQADALASDQIMPRYEELMRQYYKTIAEQKRKREGE